MGKESEKRRYTAAGNLGFVLLGLRRYSHYWLFWCAINTLFGTILPFIAVFLPKLLIDELTGLQRIPLFVYLLLGQPVRQSSALFSYRPVLITSGRTVRFCAVA